ncbi:MAG: hypothetical protein C0599_06825 [Salinivirgaceae bacterium]|nr:MAG: hypothetical protein C0599_06825 [Salinivirgaceae bacterium]
MADLSTYISDLLYLHNCVIIPQLGGFIANYKSAEIDYGKQVIYPPSKTVLFNNALKQDDGLLINFIAHNQKVSYRVAGEWLSSQVKDIQHTLRTEGLVILKGLGAFYLDENQQFQFRTDLDKNLLGDAYGLTTLRLPSVISVGGKNELKTVPISSNQGGNMSKKTLLKVAAILGPILVIAAIIPFLTDYFSGNNQQTAGVSGPSPDKEIVKEDSNKVDELATKKKQALFYSEESHEFVYHIIAGSYNKIDNAQVLADKLSESGNTAKVVEQDGKFRVSIHQYTDRYEALQKLDFLRKTTDDSYWILKVEK